jgi:ABC-2 type transport system permease protein
VDSLSGFAVLVGPLLDQQVAQLREARQRLAELRATIERIDQRLAAATDGSALPSAQELDQIDAQLTELEQMAARFNQLPAEVLSAPFELKLQSVAPFEPSAIGYYAPAVLALLLQHLAVTLAALSMARIRLIGLMELLKASPVQPGELVVGNYLSYGALCVITGGALTGLLVWLLRVPIFGSLALFVATVLLLIFCSLGLGFIISLLSSSEQQAAQLSMLVLIASVFFSGFMIFLDAIEWPVRAVSYLLPTTYAIDALRDIMLRGVLRQPFDLAILGLGGLAFFLLTILLFRHEFRAR